MGKEWNSFFAVFFVMATSLSGCLGEDSSDDSPIVVEAGLPDGFFVTDSTGNYTDVAPLEMQFYFSNVGEQGAEPSIGMTSSGCIFFTAFEKAMRSCDSGESWEDVSGPQCAF